MLSATSSEREKCENYLLKGKEQFLTIIYSFKSNSFLGQNTCFEESGQVHMSHGAIFQNAGQFSPGGFCKIKMG